MTQALLDAMARYLIESESVGYNGPMRLELLNRWRALRGSHASLGVPLWYVAHPVSGPCEHERGCHGSIAAAMGMEADPPGLVAGFKVACNVARARRWLRWLLDAAPRVSLVMSWLPYLDVLPDADPVWRERGMRDDCAVAASCAGIILVGGRTSRGMERERNACTSAGGAVVDLTYLGPHPPTMDQRHPSGLPLGLPYPIEYR